MNKEFIPYEQALELKELGFDEPCFTHYFNDNGQIRNGLSIHINNGWTYSGANRLETTLAPLYQQAFRWFRERHNITHLDLMAMQFFEYKIPYEEAELACLIKLIEIVKGGNK